MLMFMLTLLVSQRWTFPSVFLVGFEMLEWNSRVYCTVNLFLMARCNSQKKDTDIQINFVDKHHVVSAKKEPNHEECDIIKVDCESSSLIIPFIKVSEVRELAITFFIHSIRQVSGTQPAILLCHLGMRAAAALLV